MKIKKCVVFTFLCLGVVLLYGVQFEDVVIDPTNPLKINAATYDSGVYRSVAGGNAGTWTSFNTGLPVLTVKSLEVHPTDPSTMFTGISGDEVYYSSNGGNNWAYHGWGLPANAVINTLAHDPFLYGVIYAGDLDTGGVYKSSINGASWTLVSSTWNVRDLAIDPAATSTVFAGTTTGIHKSTDGGATWTEVLPADYDIHAIAIDPTNSDIVYASGEENDDAVILKSYSGGGLNTWEEIYRTYIELENGRNGYSSALVVDPIVPNTVYAGTLGAGVLKSTDGGTIWNPVNINLGSLRVTCLAIDHTVPTKLFAGTVNGLFKTTSGGSNWFQVL